MSQHIHQEIVVEAPPARVYEVLTDGAKFSAMSGGAPAQIDARAGGAFSCFGGMIHGHVLEVVPGERLVQAWRVEVWEPGLYSIARFTLRSEGAGTRVVLDHQAFPDGQETHLAEGWHANYWTPLRAALQG